MAFLAVLALIPWTGERPRPVVPPTPPLAAPCRAADLRPQLAVQGAGGATVGTVRLTNVGSRACSLLGTPKVSLRGARVTRGPLRPAPLEVIRAPMAVLRALRRGRTAWFEVHFTNWCADRAPVLVLALGAGSRLRIPFGRFSRCESAKAPAHLGVSPYGPPQRTLPPSSRLPLRAEIIGARHPAGKPGLLAFRTRRGEVLRYVVTLTNWSRRPFRFRNCPTFRQQLSSGGDEAFVLNCRPMGTLAPRATARFEMRIRVPRRAALGNSVVSWLLAPKTYLPPFATSVVIVER